MSHGNPLFMDEITGVLLAAGFSSRFGDNKLLHELEGRPLISYSAAALQACDHILAVVQNDKALISILNHVGIECVMNTQAERGMGFSIACAVNASPTSHGWCLLPADMPHVRPSTTQQLVDALNDGAELAAPFYRGQRGHPVAFSKRFAADLSALDGNTGARTIVEQNIDRMITIDSDDAGVLVDIDTRDDIA